MKRGKARETAPPAPPPEEEERPRPIFEDLDIGSTGDRLKATQRIAEQLDAGTLQRSSAEAMLKTIARAERQGPANKHGDGVQVHFIQINSQEDADRFLAGEFGPSSVLELDA